MSSERQRKFYIGYKTTGNDVTELFILETHNTNPSVFAKNKLSPLLNLIDSAIEIPGFNDLARSGYQTEFKSLGQAIKAAGVISEKLKISQLNLEHYTHHVVKENQEIQDKFTKRTWVPDDFAELQNEAIQEADRPRNPDQKAVDPIRSSEVQGADVPRKVLPEDTVNPTGGASSIAEETHQTLTEAGTFEGDESTQRSVAQNLDNTKPRQASVPLTEPPRTVRGVGPQYEGQSVSSTPWASKLDEIKEAEAQNLDNTLKNSRNLMRSVYPYERSISPTAQVDPNTGRIALQYGDRSFSNAYELNNFLEDRKLDGLYSLFNQQTDVQFNMVEDSRINPKFSAFTGIGPLGEPVPLTYVAGEGFVGYNKTTGETFDVVRNFLGEPVRHGTSSGHQYGVNAVTGEAAILQPGGEGGSFVGLDPSTGSEVSLLRDSDTGRPFRYFGNGTLAGSEITAIDPVTGKVNQYGISATSNQPALIQRDASGNITGGIEYVRDAKTGSFAPTSVDLLTRDGQTLMYGGFGKTVDPAKPGERPGLRLDAQEQKRAQDVYTQRSIAAEATDELTLSLDSMDRNIESAHNDKLRAGLARDVIEGRLEHGMSLYDNQAGNRLDENHISLSEIQNYEAETGSAFVAEQTTDYTKNMTTHYRTASARQARYIGRIQGGKRPQVVRSPMQVHVTELTIKSAPPSIDSKAVEQRAFDYMKRWSERHKNRLTGFARMDEFATGRVAQKAQTYAESQVRFSGAVGPTLKTEADVAHALGGQVIDGGGLISHSPVGLASAEGRKVNLSPMSYKKRSGPSRSFNFSSKSPLVMVYDFETTGLLDKTAVAGVKAEAVQVAAVFLDPSQNFKEVGRFASFMAPENETLLKAASSGQGRHVRNLLKNESFSEKLLSFQDYVGDNADDFESFVNERIKSPKLRAALTSDAGRTILGAYKAFNINSVKNSAEAAGFQDPLDFLKSKASAKTVMNDLFGMAKKIAGGRSILVAGHNINKFDNVFLFGNTAEEKIGKSVEGPLSEHTSGLISKVDPANMPEFTKGSADTLTVFENIAKTPGDLRQGTIPTSKNPIRLINRKLGTIAQLFNINIFGAHDALADVLINADVLKGVVAEHYDQKPVSDLIKLIQENQQFSAKPPKLVNPSQRGIVAISTEAPKLKSSIERFRELRQSRLDQYVQPLGSDLSVADEEFQYFNEYNPETGESKPVLHVKLQDRNRVPTLDAKGNVVGSRNLNDVHLLPDFRGSYSEHSPIAPTEMQGWRKAQPFERTAMVRNTGTTTTVAGTTFKLPTENAQLQGGLSGTNHKELSFEIDKTEDGFKLTIFGNEQRVPVIKDGVRVYMTQADYIAHTLREQGHEVIATEKKKTNTVYNVKYSTKERVSEAELATAEKVVNPRDGGIGYEAPAQQPKEQMPQTVSAVTKTPSQAQAQGVAPSLQGQAPSTPIGAAPLVSAQPAVISRAEQYSRVLLGAVPGAEFAVSTGGRAAIGAAAGMLISAAADSNNAAGTPETFAAMGAGATAAVLTGGIAEAYMNRSGASAYNKIRSTGYGAVAGLLAAGAVLAYNRLTGSPPPTSNRAVTEAALAVSQDAANDLSAPRDNDELVTFTDEEGDPLDINYEGDEYDIVEIVDEDDETLEFYEPDNLVG